MVIQSELIHIKQVVKLQKKVVRIIAFSDFGSYSKPLFRKLAILPLEDINNVATAIFTYKFFNNMLPSTFDTFFQLNKELHEYNTRGSEKIHMKHGRTNYKKYTTRNIRDVIFGKKLPIRRNITIQTIANFQEQIKKVLPKHNGCRNMTSYIS